MYKVCEAVMPWNKHFDAKIVYLEALYIISINKKDPVYSRKLKQVISSLQNLDIRYLLLDYGYYFRYYLIVTSISDKLRSVSVASEAQP